MDMEKFCQSCGIPLTETNRGTEADGTLSPSYCNLCYRNGAFVEPNITFAEMKAKGIAGINNSNDNFVKKTMLKLFYPMQLKGLRRWRNR